MSFFKNCHKHGSMLLVVFKNLVRIFEYLGSQKSWVIIINMSVAFWTHFGTFALWLLCVGWSTLPVLSSKLYWLCLVLLVAFITFLSIAPSFFFAVFVYDYSHSSICASISSVFVVYIYVASSFFIFLTRWYVCSGLQQQI